MSEPGPEGDDSIQTLVYLLFFAPLAFLLFVQYWPRHPLFGG